jgi:hypothetical protein
MGELTYDGENLYNLLSIRLRVTTGDVREKFFAAPARRALLTTFEISSNMSLKPHTLNPAGSS